jgi:hypothetical protein
MGTLMDAKTTPVTSYTIEFNVASRVGKVVHATDDDNQPNKYTSSPSLSEDELVELCREVVGKAAAAYQHTQRTFDLLIDQRGYILRERSSSPSLLAGFGLAGPVAEAAVPREASADKPKVRKPKRAKPKPAATKPKRTPTARKAKKK